MLEMFINQLISKVEKTFKDHEHLLYDSSIGSKSVYYNVRPHCWFLEAEEN